MIARPIDPQPYTGPDVVCPKCGNQGASTRYLSYGNCAHFGDENLIAGTHVNERLHRECDRCDHSWDEAIVGPRRCGNCPSCRGESDTDTECERPIGADRG